MMAHLSPVAVRAATIIPDIAFQNGTLQSFSVARRSNRLSGVAFAKITPPSRSS
jgi:hypothetical protein